MPDWFSTWPEWAQWVAYLVIVALVLTLLWVARPNLHNVLKAVFFGISHWLSRISIWFGAAGESMYDQYCETVAAHRAEEYQQRLYRHNARIANTVSVDTGNVMDATGKLEVSAISIEGAARSLSDVNLSREAELEIKRAMADKDTAKNTVKLVQNVKTALSAKVLEVRPDIQKIRQELPALQRNIERLHESEQKLSRAAESINADLAEFSEAIHSDDRRAVAEKESIVIPWVLALLVMSIALFGVFLNFFLIQRPMAEIVGDDIRVVGLSLPTTAAIVVIFLEAAAGIVLMESLRITRLMKISELSDSMRRVFLVAAVVVLLGFSAFEALLAFQREALIELDQRTQELAQGIDPVAGTAPVVDAGDAAAGEEDDAHENGKSLSFALWAQVILAVIIPWLLATAAIPLETVVQNLWFILRLAAHQILMFLSVLSKVLATAIRSFGLFLLRLYDLIIFLPLAIEQMVRRTHKPTRGDYS